MKIVLKWINSEKKEERIWKSDKDKQCGFPFLPNYNEIS